MIEICGFKTVVLSSFSLNPLCSAHAILSVVRAAREWLDDGKNGENIDLLVRVNNIFEVTHFRFSLPHTLESLPIFAFG